MDSPSTAEAGPAPTDGEATPLPGTVQVAAGLRARRVPLLSTPRVRALDGIGDVGRAARRFSALAGLSLSARRAMQDQRSTVQRMPVRPPDYWTGYQEQEEERVANRQTTGDAALDALIARRGGAKRVARKAQHVQVQRGLPSTVHRRSNSVAGPMTAPGGMARRLQPAAMVPTPNPANSPQTAASREPRPAAKPANKAAKRPGGRDRPRPTGPASATPNRAARRAATPEPAASSTIRRTPEGAATTTTSAVAASATAAADAAVRRAATPTTPARRSAAPAELDPGAAPAAAAVTTDAATADEAAPPVLGPEPSQVPGGSGTENAADERADLDLDLDDDDVAPAWPGDLPEAPAASVSPFAPATVGRRIAVQPLLAGWRAPTAWRSISAGNGLRLLPVGASALPGSWATPAAPGDGGEGSWADTVRRFAAAAGGPGAVRHLPVGGPSVIVRDGASGEAATGERSTVRRSGATATSGEGSTVRRATATSGTGAASTGSPAPSSTASSRAAAAAGAASTGPSAPSRAAAGRTPSSSTSSTTVRRATTPGDTWLPVGGRRAGWSPAASWSSPIGARTAASAAPGSPVVLRRHVADTPAGRAVEVTAWSLPPGAPTGARPGIAPAGLVGSVPAPAATLQRTPGFRPEAARRPGGWLGRAAARAAGAVTGFVQRVPLGPLGPVRWSTRADEPVVARRTDGSSSWAASVAAASAAMSGSSSTANLPVAGGLTLIRGGRADGSDLPAAAVQRATAHPAAARLRLVPPLADAAAGASSPGSAAGIQRSIAAPASSTPAATPATAWVGRAPTGANPFVSVPGAVAAHGLPAARAALVGVTASGAGVGPATPGSLGRLAHGQPIRRRVALELAPPAVVLRSASPDGTAAQHPGRPGLPETPAALARRRQAQAHVASVAGGSVAATPGATAWAQRVAAATGGGGSPAALAALMAASPAAPTLVQRTITPATSTPAARLTWPTRSTGTADQQAALAPQPGAKPTWRERVAAAAEGRSVPDVQAKASAPTAPGRLVSAPVYATGGAPVASLRGLPVAPAAFGVVQGGQPAGDATVRRSTSNPSGPHARRRNASPHGVSATVVRRSRDHRPGVVADRWRAVDVPARALPGRGPNALRPIGAPVPARTVERTPAERRPMRPDAPGAAARFEEVLRRSEEKVRTAALPVRFRPLADRIVGRMPVQIATGRASQAALAAVGTSAATTGSVIHLPSAPDGSARMAGILAHELTHVAAASAVPRFHGGVDSVEEHRANTIERVVARAARSGDAGRGPVSVGTAGLPVGGPVALQRSPEGPPVPASAAGPSISGGGMNADDLARSIEGGGSGQGGRSIQRTASTGGTTTPPPGFEDRIVRRRSMTEPKAPPVPAPVESKVVLDEETMDKIVRALEARLLESIERRGGMWRGGF
jgi:hypothetical protein